MKKLSLVLASASLMVLVSCGGGGTTLESTEAVKVSALSSSIIGGDGALGALTTVKANVTETVEQACNVSGTQNITVSVSETSGDMSASIAFVACVDAVDNPCTDAVTTSFNLAIDGDLNIDLEISDLTDSSATVEMTESGTLTFSGAAVEYMNIMDGTTELTSVDCAIDLTFSFAFADMDSDPTFTWSGSICGATVQADGSLLSADGTALTATDFCPTI